GNWSDLTYEYLVVYDPNGPYVISNGNNFITPDASSILPFAATGHKASFDFSIKYDAAGNIVQTPGKKQLVLGWDNKGNAGDKCTDTGIDCFEFASTETNWLVLPNLTATFQGSGRITRDGVLLPDTYTYRVDATDNGTTGDTFVLKIFSQGQDPNTATPLYRFSGTTVKINGDATNGVTIQ
ncbi:MAG: hypothetical protein K0S68_397, partial [Candidatus Saccharibacteria bacterium]|nr:hypothetical protein [Candidatus Saccharibacteria bacterium]